MTFLLVEGRDDDVTAGRTRHRISRGAICTSKSPEHDTRKTEGRPGMMAVMKAMLRKSAQM